MALVLRGLSAVADAGFTFDLLVRERELPSARRAVAALPQLRVVLDHFAKPPIATGRWQPWAGEWTSVTGGRPHHAGVTAAMASGAGGSADTFVRPEAAQDGCAPALLAGLR
jgi:predicted TIM-barrel fold metal-dependent hydrolase